jgi:hypothetical protein
MPTIERIAPAAAQNRRTTKYTTARGSESKSRPAAGKYPLRLEQQRLQVGFGGHRIRL